MSGALLVDAIFSGSLKEFRIHVREKYKLFTKYRTEYEAAIQMMEYIARTTDLSEDYYENT